MSNLDQLDRELREYLEMESNLRRGDRLALLKGIFSRHLEFNEYEHLVTSKDLFNILSDAKNIFTKIRLPVSVSRKQIEAQEAPNVAIIEAFVLYLNKMSLVKRLIKFDYTE